ncbi:MAG: sugar ABC transporter permease [Actinomycetes bacterium]|jgi:D-xylose transport system permease protein
MTTIPADMPSTPADEPKGALSDFALDSQKQTFTSAIADTKARLRSGELGSLPAVLAIIVLVAIFSFSSDTFLTALNFANFLEQAAAVIVISMAVTFVLLLGEIDLAAGYTAGVTAAVLALRLQDGWGLLPSVLIAATAAALLGLWTGALVAKLGIPSFVVTLANFLVFQGILLILVKEGGSVRIENDVVKGMVGNSISPGLSWVIGVLGVAGFAALQYRQAQRSGAPLSIVAVKTAFAAVLILVVVAVLNRNRAFANAVAEQRGMPYVIPLVLLIVLVLTFVLNRTRYGRHLMAVGGNQEAARRAGINVARIRLSAFVFCGLLAGIGGAFLASRVNSVDPNTGGNDTLLLAVGAAVIGGTSLFGGKGRMVNAILGGLVLALIPNGLTLVGKREPFGVEIDFGSSGVKFICAGLALMLAASVDAISRKRTS